MSAARLPILTYHAIQDAPGPVFTPPAVFESHLAALREAGYSTVRASDVIAWLRGEANLPERSVVLTFDDGYESLYAEAWPRLRAHGFTGMVFVIADYCGKSNRWPGHHASIPTAPLLSWDQIGEMAASGDWELGAHTRSHPVLTQLSAGQAEDEIAGSKQLIAQHTGAQARVFAYPYGAYNSGVEAVVKRHFEAAATVRLGFIRRQSDPYRLARIDSYYLTPGMIGKMGTLSFLLYLTGRALLRGVRRLVSPL